MNEAFMSDNTACVDSRVMDAIADANNGFAMSYGNDQYTKKAEELIKAEFGENAKFYPVLTGTGANVIALSSVLSPFQAIVSAETAHINVDECGAPERFLSSKIIGIKTELGKLTPEDIKPTLHSIGFEHHSQPYVISISQVTETGVTYSPDELKALSDFAKVNNMILHIDGSRMANAAAHLGCSLAEAVAGADIISFGGTKNGMMMGEAVIVLSDIAHNMKYFRKQGMQLFSKMRFLSAQFIPYIADGIWRENAAHANNMAQKLAKGFADAHYKFAYPVNSNGVFVYLNDEIIEKLSKDFGFYVWDEETKLCRFMCSFATKAEDVEALLSLL